jgi:hypothetical protein
VARHFGGRGVAARLPQREFAGTRFDMDGNMTSAAQPLSDKDIEVLAEYLSASQ